MGHSIKEVNRVYGVKGKRGLRVEVDGRSGRITSARGHYFMVKFDSYYKYPMPCHPTWRFNYCPLPSP